MSLPVRLLAWFTAAVLASAAVAQQPPFPILGKPIRLILPAGPGNVVDARARQIADKLGTALGQPVIVENRPGASGTLAVQEAAKAAADGHTIFNGNIQTHALNELLLPDAPRVDPALVPVTKQNSAPLIVVVNRALPASTLAELFALAKARPGQLNYGTGGLGATSHLYGEPLAAEHGIEMRPIHYKSVGGDLVDLAAGELQVGFHYYTGVVPYLQAGKIRALAVAGTRRIPALADVPTVAESGFASLEFYGWSGFFVPAGTPAQAVDRLQREIARILHSKEIRDSHIAAGAEVHGDSPRELAAFIAAERERLGRLIRDRNIRAQ